MEGTGRLGDLSAPVSLASAGIPGLVQTRVGIDVEKALKGHHRVGIPVGVLGVRQAKLEVVQAWVADEGVDEAILEAAAQEPAVLEAIRVHQVSPSLFDQHVEVVEV